MDYARFHSSLQNHQIKTPGIMNTGLRVTLTASDNTYIKYPCKGVLVIKEQGTSLHIAVAVFHALRDDGSLGPPVSASNPVFIYGDPMTAEPFKWTSQNERLNAIRWLNEQLRKNGQPAIHEGLDPVHPAMLIYNAIIDTPCER